MEQNIPPFMQKYYDGCDYEGQEAIKRLASLYEDERRRFFETIFNHKQNMQRDWNRFTGLNNKITQEEAIASIDKKYKMKVEKLAEEYGYKESPEPVKHEQVAEVSVESERLEKKKAFLDNLNSIRQRQQEQKQTIRPR